MHGRLIIVDDEPIILNLLRSVFEGEAYEVLACANGKAALEAMQGGVDVLLTDKNLPDINGLDLLREAKRIQPDCEGIVITGYASLDTVIAAMQLDAFDYIVKPPKDIFDVRRKVRQAFEKVRLGRENRRLLNELTQRNAALEQALTSLREVQAELVQSEKLAGIGVLAAGVAHEVSSPLFGVLGLAEAIQVEPDAALARTYAAEIVDYARSIKEIVVQLSGYARDAQQGQEEAVEWSRVAEDAVRLVTRTQGIPPGTVTLQAVDGLVVRANATELQQVMVNLVKNAVEACIDRHGDPAQVGFAGQVKVTLRQNGRWGEAEVQDNGPGIPPERRSLIFDPFYTTKPPGRGTGLGLNIVYRLVTKARGTVQVDSEPGQGATFTVRLPLEPGP
jgi:C4-dicarboxylate-specific signal transduction histidine kinase